jgi:hypothetical protein
VRLHLLRISGFQLQPPGRSGVFVPQTSQSAVSRVSQPAIGTPNWRARPTDDPPIWKSAIQQVRKPVVHPRKIRIKCCGWAAPQPRLGGRDRLWRPPAQTTTSCGFPRPTLIRPTLMVGLSRTHPDRRHQGGTGFQPVTNVLSVINPNEPKNLLGHTRTQLDHLGAAFGPARPFPETPTDIYRNLA